MSSSEKKTDKKNAGETSAYMGWICLAGIVAGIVTGALLGHWFVWAIFLGVLGLTIGAVIDRNRR